MSWNEKYGTNELGEVGMVKMVKVMCYCMNLFVFQFKFNSIII